MSVIVWRNGAVWINSDERTNALAARDGVIVAHGDDALALIDSADEVIDLEGRTLGPGFGDGHAHPVFGGIETLFAPVRGHATLEDLLAAVKKWAQENPDAEWVRGEGYDPSLAPRGEFDAHWLDEIVPDRPVVLRAMDYHTAWVNTAAMKRAGITRDTPQPIDGDIAMRPDGTPMGTLREWGAWGMVYDLLPALNAEQNIKAVQAASLAFASAGVTWAQDAWVSTDTLEAWLAGAQAGVLTFRANLAWLAEPEGKWRTAFPTMAGLKARVDNEAPELLTGHTIKFFADGVLEGGTAAVLEPYCDCPTSHGIPNWRREELIEAVIECVGLGFQPHIHAIGDAGVRNALDAFENAIAVHGTANNPIMAHCQLVDADDLDRYRSLGVIANFEPLWAQLEAEQTVLTIPRLGQERADRQYPIATLLRGGAKVSFGSDWPVTSPVPMKGIGIAVTRTTDHGVGPWNASECITLDEALTAYTHGVAVQAGETQSWGDLSLGKRADVVLFDSDIHSLKPFDLRNVGVIGTWLGGKRVFG
ncbi:MAG: amidohydrolase [Actinomycetes bacterium]